MSKKRTVETTPNIAGNILVALDPSLRMSLPRGVEVLSCPPASFEAEVSGWFGPADVGLVVGEWHGWVRVLLPGSVVGWLPREWVLEQRGSG